MILEYQTNTKEYMTEWGRRSTGNCARDSNLIIVLNGISTKQNPSGKIRCIKFSGILRCKRITWSQRKDLTSCRLSRKGRTFCLVVFSIPVDHMGKIIESEKIVRYLDLARELKMLFNMWVKVIWIEVGALGIVLKSLVKKLEELGIRRRIKTLCRDQPEYWEESWNPEETCCHSDSCKKLPVVKNSQATVRPIVFGTLGTVIEGLVRELDHLEIRGRVETIQTMALLRSARVLRRVLETWGDLLSLNFQWETIS